MENPSSGLLSFGLLLVGVLLLIFSGGDIGGQITVFVKNKFVRIFIGILGIVLLGIGLVGVVRNIFPSSQNELVAATDIPISTIAPTFTATIPPIVNPTETQSVVIEQTSIPADCLSTEFVAPIMGDHPPIDTVICVPSGSYTWISSDPAQFSISSIGYNQTFNVGYTFFLFGPVKFTVSGVQSKYIWMDTRNDVSLFGHLDEKSLNLIYQDGKVCDLALYAGTACP
jgi:hypothetical protein